MHTDNRVIHVNLGINDAEMKQVFNLIDVNVVCNDMFDICFSVFIGALFKSDKVGHIAILGIIINTYSGVRKSNREKKGAIVISEQSEGMAIFSLFNK